MQVDSRDASNRVWQAFTVQTAIDERGSYVAVVLAPDRCRPTQSGMRPSGDRYLWDPRYALTASVAAGRSHMEEAQVVENPVNPIHPTRSERSLAAERLIDGRMSRRDLLQRAFALGLSAPVIAGLLAACGGDDTPDATNTTTGGDAASPTSAGGQTSPTSAGQPATTPAGGDTAGISDKTLVIGNNNEEIFTLDPSEYYEIRAVPAMFSMYQPLIYQDYSSGEANLTSYVPILASEVPSLENGGISEDGLTYTVKLREGVKFHTGNEMTADDWVFSIKRLWFLKKNPSFLAEPFSVDENVGVEAIDPLTLKFTLLAPNAAFLAYLAGLSYLAIDSKVAAEKGALDTPAA